MKHKMFNVILIVLMIFLLLAICYGVVRASTIGQINHISINKSDENLGIKRSKELEDAIARAEKFSKVVEPTVAVEDVVVQDNPLNILLLGIDSRGKNDRGRSDAIMLLTVDFKGHKLKLSSFIRDTQVEIRGRKDKLNHAYSYGGGEESIRVMNENFNLDIRDFAEVNMFTLRDVIDSIGGLDLEITESERKEINYRVREIAEIEKRKDYGTLNSSGFQHLTGEQVVAYARIRNTSGGDFKRTERQREVVELAINKMRDKSVIELVGVVQKVLPLISTTLTTNEIESIILQFFKGGMSFGVEQTRFPSDSVSKSDMSTGVYYLRINDTDGNIEEIHNFIYGDSVLR